MTESEKVLQDLKDTLIRNVNHELRAPLTIVQGYAELMRDGGMGALAPEQQETMFVITNHIEELRTLIDRINILMSSQAEGRVRLPTRLDQLATQVLDAKRDAARKAGLTMGAEVDSNVPSILCDPYQVQHGIECLVENAIKFTPAEGRIKVQVYVDGNHVCCAVCDSGIGIEPDRLNQIMQGFRQGDGSTTRRHRGFGLGMAVIQTLIQTHSGQMQAVSQPGQGSQFTLRLPISTVGDNTDPRPDQPVQPRTKRRILAVDDERNVVLALRSALRKLPNCQVIMATSGPQALELCAQEPFDLLITDFMMPDMDGLELATLVRQRYPQTAIIMVTAYGDSALRAQADSAAIRHILDKPFEVQQIRAAALEALATGKPV